MLTRAINVVRALLAYLQRTAPNLSAINAGLYHFVADLLCKTIAILAERATWRIKAYLTNLSDQMLVVVWRDPRCSVLVVAHVRYCDHLGQALRQHPEGRIVDYAWL